MKEELKMLKETKFFLKHIDVNDHFYHSLIKMITMCRE